MRSLALFIAVTAIAVVQQYVAGPLGLAWDLDRTVVFVASFVGGMIGVVTLVLAGPQLMESLTGFLRRLFRRPEKPPVEGEDRDGQFVRLADRLGAPFLGIAGPLTIGGWAAALLGVASGIGKLKLVAWLAVGQALVTAVYVYSIAELTD